MPYEQGISSRKSCPCQHTYCCPQQEGAVLQLARKVIRDRSRLAGQGPLHHPVHNAMGLLEFETRNPVAGSHLVAARDIPPGTLIGVAWCAIKVMDPHELSKTEDTDMNYRWGSLLSELNYRLHDMSFACHDGRAICHQPTAASMQLFHRFNEQGLSVGPALRSLDSDDVVMCPKEGEVIRYANLPTPPHNAMTKSEHALQSLADTQHNSSLFSITNQPWYGVVSCKPIKRSEALAVHYGPCTGVQMKKVALQLSRA